MSDNTQATPQITPSPVEMIAAALRELVASPADAGAQERGRAALAAFDAETDFFVVVQEGGSSGEFHVMAVDTEEDALAYRRSCAGASYRTSDAIAVPAIFGACGGNALLDLLNNIAHAEFEYEDTDEEEDEEEPEEA